MDSLHPELQNLYLNLLTQTSGMSQERRKTFWLHCHKTGSFPNTAMVFGKIRNSATRVIIRLKTGCRAQTSVRRSSSPMPCNITKDEGQGRQMRSSYCQAEGKEVAVSHFLPSFSVAPLQTWPGEHI